METTVIIVLGIVSLSLGGALVFMVLRSANRGIDTDNVVQTLTTQFGQLSFEALSKAQTSFLDLANTRFKNLSDASGAELEQKRDSLISS